MGVFEHKSFKITTSLDQQGRWIARISKTDGSMLRVALPNSSGPRPWLDTDPPTYSEQVAILLAKDAIDGGNLK